MQLKTIITILGIWSSWIGSQCMHPITHAQEGIKEDLEILLTIIV